MLAADAAAIAASAALIADDDAASLAAMDDDIDDDAAMSADEAAIAADEAASAGAVVVVVVVVSAGLLQAARATAATREANRSDLFMNILEENWVRTITGNFWIPAVTAGTPRKRQQDKLEHFLCLALHYTHSSGTLSQAEHR